VFARAAADVWNVLPEKLKQYLIVCIWNFLLPGPKVHPFTIRGAFPCCQHLLEMATQFPGSHVEAGVGLFRSTMHKWELVPSANCRCGAEEQTADNIL